MIALAASGVADPQARPMVSTAASRLVESRAISPPRK